VTVYARVWGARAVCGGREIDRANAVYRMNFAPMKHYKVDVGEHTHTQCVNPEKMRLQLKENTAGGCTGASTCNFQYVHG
jgi:hypothetical protein